MVQHIDSAFPIVGTIRSIATGLQSGENPYYVLTDNLDPVYSVLDGYSKEIQDSENGCSGVTILGDATEAVGGVAATASILGGGLDSSAAGASARDLVESTARDVASGGVDSLRSNMTPGELRAYDLDPGRGSRFLGQVVHRVTAQRLAPKGFDYQLRGPDFVGPNGESIELTTTTPGQVAAHQVKGGAYTSAEYATYTLPTG